MIVVDAILDFVVVAVVIVVLKEGLKELRNTILDRSLFKDLVNDELSNELDIAENVLLFVLEEGLLVFRALELRELLDFLIKRVLNSFNKEIFEGIVLLSFFLFLYSFELELIRVALAEITAQLSVGAGIFGLVPCLLNDFLNQGSADIHIFE